MLKIGTKVKLRDSISNATGTITKLGMNKGVYMVEPKIGGQLWHSDDTVEEA
jgi:hypothetical protein